MRYNRYFSGIHALIASILIFLFASTPSMIANAATIPLIKNFQHGSIENGMYIVASHDNPNYVLDLVSGKPTAGQNVQMYNKNGTQSQQWYFGCVDAKNDIYEIRPARAIALAYTGDVCDVYHLNGVSNSWQQPDYNHMALDVSGGAKQDGTNVQIWGGNGSTSQQWKLLKRSNGSYRLQSMVDSSSEPFLLNIADTITNQVNVQMWHHYNGVVRTEFDLNKVDDGITKISSKTMEPVDKNAEPIRYSRLVVNDSLQPANSKPVIDTAYTNVKYQDLSASIINDKHNDWIFNFESASSKATMTWAQVGTYDGRKVGVRMTMDNPSPTNPANRCNSWNGTSANGQWEQLIGTDKYVRIASRFAGISASNEDFIIRLGGVDFQYEFFYTDEYNGQPNASINPIDIKYSIFTCSDMNEDGSGQEGVQAVDKWTGRAYALDVSGVSMSTENKDSVGRTGNFYYGFYPHINDTHFFNGQNNAMENSVGLQFKGNGMKLRICDNAGYIGFHMAFDSFGKMPSFAFFPGFTKTVDGVQITKEEREKFSFTAERISAPNGCYSFDATTVRNGDDGFYIDEKPQEVMGDYIYKITEKSTAGYTTAAPFYLKENVSLDDDDKMVGTLYSSQDGETWTELGDSNVTANNYAYKVNNNTLPSSISLVKKANKDGIYGDDAVPGNALGYTFTIKNTGKQTLKDITLTDSKLATAPVINWGSNTTHTLAPNETVTATGTYTLTSKDAANSDIENTATVTATDQLGRSVNSSSETSTPVNAISSIFVTKSVSPSTITDGDASIGKTLTWTIKAKNMGTQTLTNVNFTDSLNGLSALSVDWNGNTTGRIVPNETATATATYKITAADVKRGYVTNTAYATCNDLRGNSLRSNDATATATISGKNGLTLTKSVDTTYISADDAVAGKTINYTIQITNTGNKRLTGLTINDPKVAPATVTPKTTTLGAGESTTATVSYAITDEDIKSGQVVNTATSKAYDDDGTEVDSNEGTATTTIVTPKPGLSLSKVANKQRLSGDEAKAGTVITYTITATNTGNTTIRNQQITDSMEYDGNPSLTIDTLAPGKTKVFTAKHTVTQVDIDSGSIVNKCKSADDGKLPPTTTETTTGVVQSSALTITKDVDIKSIAANDAIAGKTLTYTIKVTNTGYNTINDITLNDSLTAAKVGTLDKTTLAPNESATAKATYDITDDDILNGKVINTVKATGTDSGGTKVTSNTAQAQTDISTPNSKLAIVKTVDKTSLMGDEAKAGHKLHYTITITNNGNTTITGITTSDNSQAGPTTVSLDKTVLNPGEQATGTFDYAITQVDIDRGTVSNTVSATGTKPNGTGISTSKSTAITTIQQTNGLSIEKTVDKGTIQPADARPGTKLTYSFLVKNTGTTTVKNIAVVDSMTALGTVKLDKTTLAPNETATGTATYAITQSDIDNGTVVNTAHATGTDNDGSSVTSTDSTATTTITAQKTGLVLEKTVDKAQLTGDGAKAGAELAYGFKITNTGNVTITGVSISDTLNGLSAITMTWPGKTGTLEAGKTATGTAKYNVKQSDIDRGNITNTAKATGTNETTGDTITSNTAKATTGIDRVLKIGVSKKADPTKISAQNALPGTNITYAISVKNNGNTTIDLTATDSMADIGNVALSKATLAPGETATATVKHAITQDEINAGTVSNTVSATGTTTDKTMSTSGKSTVETTIEKAVPKLTLEKTVDKTELTADESKVGTKLTYTFKITNAGNVTINDINIADKLEGISDIKMHYPTTEGELAPGETATGTATYTIQLFDISTSYVNNTAQATGKNKTTGSEVDSNKSTATTSIVRNMSLSLKKTSNPTKVSPIDAVPGTKIKYTFEVENTGNTALSDIEINDEMQSIGTIKPQKTSLNPGEKTTATADYTLTQADIEAGHVTNTATAEGGIPDKSVTSNKATADTPIEKATSKLTLEKTVDKTTMSSDEAKAGTKLTYSFKLTNGGNIPINDVTIDDKLNGLSEINIDWKGHDRTIQAGETVTGTATYQITQEDIDAGTIKNTATATGTDAHGGKLTSTSNATTDIARAGKLETTKTADKTNIAGNEAKLGTVITYTVTVKNTGNVTLHNVTCDDTMKEIGKIALNKTELAPNDTATGTATHTLTQADIDAGFVKNTASSSADSPDSSKVVSNESSVTTTVSQNAQLDVEKTADITHIDANDAIAGKKISYSLKITNTGNATITDIELNDELVKSNLSIDWNGNSDRTLKPGQSITAKANYQITDGDIDNGIIENTAFATGKMANGTSVKSNTAKASTTIEKMKPLLSIVKTGTKQVSADDVKPGHEIEFDFNIENTGNTTLNDIKIDDDLAGISDISIDKTTLDAGEKTTGKATYKITQADIDAGTIKNTATASSKTKNGKTIKSNESEHDVTIDGKSSLSIEKKVDKESVKGTADELKKTTLTYSFIVKNIGTTTVSGVKITDNMNGLSDITFGSKKTSVENKNTNDGNDSNTNSSNESDDASGELSNEANDNKNDIVLKPGEEIEATATYMITDDDIALGHITNMAKATGKAPNGDDIESAENEATTQIEKDEEQQPQTTNISSDLMQTGIGIAVPSLIAFVGIGTTVSIRRKRRNRR